MTVILIIVCGVTDDNYRNIVKHLLICIIVNYWVLVCDNESSDDQAVQEVWCQTFKPVMTTTHYSVMMSIIGEWQASGGMEVMLCVCVISSDRY